MIDLRTLAVETVTDPRSVADKLMQLGLSQSVLWMALFLAVVLNTILNTLSNLVVPSASPLPAALEQPAIFLMMAAGGLVLTVHALFWTGRAMGGQATLADLLVLMVWLQFLRVAVQAVALVLMVVAPLVAGIVVIVASVLALWIMVHFINAAHRFNSMGQAFVVLIVGTLAIAIGLVVLLSLIGITAVGSSAYV